MSLRDDLLARFPALVNLPGDAYVVGGAIRDLLRGESPADVDVACLDPLACARAVGPKPIRLGKDHLSAWRVVLGTHVYDFAEILDGDIGRDLARRDFTVNGMAVALGGGGLLDPHGGRRDLDRGVVRMIDAANFDDDPLRLLKGVRMAVALGFDIVPATVAAMRQRAEAIVSVSPERVTYELSIVFSSGRFRSAIEWLHQTGLDAPLFGRELDAARFHADGVPVGAAYALVVEDPRAFAERWRWSTALLRRVIMIKHLLGERGDLMVALYDAGEEAAREYIAALRALGRDDRVALPDFSTAVLLDGAAIAAITGQPPGKELGRIKRALLEAQVRGDVRTREEAEAFVRAAQV